MYHATTEESWKEIQEEGVLWGRKNRYWMGKLMERCTWFAFDVKNARYWMTDGSKDWTESDVVLEVDTEDMFQPKQDEEDWQRMSCDPIPITSIKRINAK